MTTLGVKIASNSLLPPDVGGQFNQASWTAGAADALANGIIQQAIANNGNTSSVGMPASWPYGPIPPGAVRADGTISPLLWSQIQGYVNSSAAQSDADFGDWLGVQYSQAAPGGIMDAPLTASEQLARDQFEFQKAQALLKLATGGGSSGGTSTPRISTPRTSGGGGGGSASSLADDLALLNARTDASSSLAQQEFDLKKELMLLQFQLDNDPNNPNLLLKRDQLAEQVRQFNATLALQEKSQQNETAKVIADYSANPGDAVAREYFLRGKAQPVGNAVNIFTGQPTGQQMTFSQMMQANAPAAGAALNASLTGQPAQTQQPDTAATEQPVEDQTPQYALGTGDYSPPPMSGQMPAHSPRPTPFSMPSTARRPEITPDGWTRAKQFIAGDPQIPGTENPEHIKMRVRNGEPEAKVTPLSHMMRGHRMPMYADGTSDPFYGTTYQGMDPNAVVTNANSQYYGMTAQQAFDAQNRNILNLQSYDPRAVDSLGQATGYAPAIVVGPTVGMTSGGFTGADPVKNPEAFWSDPGYWIGDTSTPRQVINVNNQADAGILTGAQMSNGVTQSAAPGLPGYQRPSDLPPLPGSGSMGVTTSTDTTQGGTQTDSVKPATSSATPTSGEAGGPTNEPTVPTSNGITAPTTTGINLGAPDAGGNKLVMGPGTFTKDGATYTLQQGDYQRPDGTWVRYDPIYKEYMPIQPTSYTPITSEDQFWRLPDDVRQKIMRGEPTGYALVGNWRDSLFAGYGGGSTILPREQYLGLPEAEQRALLNGTSTDPAQFGPAGAPLPYQYHDPRVAFGPMQGGLSGLLRMGFDQTDRGPNLNDYYPYLVNRGAGGSADIPINDAAARVLGVPTQAEQAAIEQAIMNAANPPVPQPTTPPPAGTGTGATSGSGAGTTTGTGTGTTNGTGTGTGTTTGTGTGTGTTTGTGSTSALAQALAQLLGLSYGSGAYQNLPSLLFAGGGDAGQYDTVSNQPIEVPGLGITLPSASQMMNYEMLNKLQQNGSFDLLNSLYTAGNVPLSILLKMAEARAPRGSAYEPGLVSTV